MTTSTNLSRRKLLATVPAAAAAIAPAAATALCRLSAEGEDPVFAAIERHRKAFEEWQAAGKVHTQLRSEHEAQRGLGVYLGERPETEMLVEYADGRTYKLDSKHLPAGPGDALTIAPTGRTVPFYARFPADIDDNVPADCTDPEAWKAQKHREWSEWSHGGENSPQSNAFDAWNEAHRRYIMATAKLNVRPATLAAVAAMLRYIAEIRDDEEDWNLTLYEEDDEDSERPPIVDNDGLFEKILETLAEAAESLGA
jgi:hypothetical protein